MGLKAIIESSESNTFLQHGVSVTATKGDWPEEM